MVQYHKCCDMKILVPKVFNDQMNQLEIKKPDSVLVMESTKIDFDFIRCDHEYFNLLLSTCEEIGFR